jgi:recombination protein RecT
MTNDPKMISRFKDVLGAKAPQFLASVVSAVSANRELQKADPTSVMASAMVAATLNLDINPSLGFAAIIPYKDSKKDAQGNWTSTVQAQFQIMTKGFVQLAIRSGQYRNLNVAEIYEDEYHGYDIVTGEADIFPVADGQRAHGETDKIVGYIAYIELTSGFRKTVFWDMDKILNHAKKFSKSYDTKTGKFYKGSAWDSHFEAMCRKTVLKNALSSWGVLSVEMQRAVVSDQAAFKDVNNLDDPLYLDNPDRDEDSLAPGEIPYEGDVQADAPTVAQKSTPKTKANSRAASTQQTSQASDVTKDGYDDLLSAEQEDELDALWNDR